MKIDNIVALSLFCVYTLKAGILGANVADAIIIIGLGAATYLYSKHSNKDDLAGLQKQLNDLKSAQFDQGTILSELRTNVTGIKLGQSMKKAQ